MIKDRKERMNERETTITKEKKYTGHLLFFYSSGFFLWSARKKDKNSGKNGHYEQTHTTMRFFLTQVQCLVSLYSAG